MVYIKNIIMTGFKSYGNGTINLAFPKGFTGIIGPNGSGKSNVVDAISFVLGELSTKSLRAKELADLIYAGTRPGDKPSERSIVNIIFDNSDRRIPVPEMEVSIQREIRAGGGGAVYRFNGKRSTRTEIMDKLKIANIDVKEGFNLVLQGRIAELATQHPEARREMIEDLAGTKEFDEKKLKALEELDKAEVKVNELDVLIRESEARVKSLSKEKENYEEWEHVSEEIYDKRTLLLSSKHKTLLNEMKANQTQIEELSQQIGEFEAQRAEIQDSMKDVTQRIQEIKDQIQQKARKVEENQNKSSNLRATLTGLKRDIKNREQRINELQQEKLQAQKKIQEVGDLIEKSKEEIIAIDDTIKDFERQKEERVAAQQNLNEQIAQRDSEYKALQDHYQELQEQINKAEKLMSNNEIQAQMKDSTIQIKRNTYLNKSNELELRKKENRQFEERLQVIKSEIEQSINLMEVAARQIESSSTKRQAYEESIEDLSRKKLEIQHRASSIEAKIETIKTFFTEDQESNPVIIKLIEKARQKEIKGVIGLLKDLVPMETLDIKEKVALTPYLNSLVVEDAMTAIAAINYLRDAGIGSATFIPLEELRQITTQEKNRFAFIEKLDKKLRSVSSIFQNMLIAENLRQAIDLWMQHVRERSFGKNVITPYGDAISQEGVISGGANKNFAEKLIPELAETLIFEKKELERISSELDLNNMKYKRLVVLLNEIQRKQESVIDKNKAREKQMEEMERKVAQNTVFIEKTERELTTINQEIEANEVIIQNLNQNRTELQQRLKSMEIEREDLKKQIEKSEIKDLFQKIRKIEKEISKLEGDIRAKNATKREKEQQINVILARNLQDNKSKIEAIEQAITQLQKDIETDQTAQGEQDTQLNQFKENETTLKSELGQLQIQVETEQASTADKQKEIANINRKIERIKQQISDVKVKNEGVVTRLSNVQKQIQELEIDLVEVTEAVNESKLDLDIQTLTNKKRSLEPVNALSVRQYQEAKLRFDELDARREDLNQERKIIVDFISKIEFEKKTIFLELFNKINREFGTIFEMIAGGTAKMELENPDQPFDGGINIIAKPGGKKVKSIQAMSGGEKSLTALALIFAMQKVDPSPFYVFDEIDAALDVMNVRKVAKVIEQISKESQCIMITHRDTAMRYTSQLYGVTNINGVSKVISVALTDEGTLKAFSS
ncbi:MAG: chromosome segregation protein SMC [Promethearchaeota archaeon]|nr:MAG: chromosome segregation protein SMC [Candidatus Lokiarchaeota archaeon]